jgi:hypothetical protein
VWLFVKRPDFKLEPQQQIILNCIEENSPIVRFELIRRLQGRLETVQPVSTLVAFHKKNLVRYGLIEILEPSEYRARKEQDKDRKMNAMIIPNNGGYSIKREDEERLVGWYPTEDAARHVVRTEILKEEPSEFSHSAV